MSASLLPWDWGWDLWVLALLHTLWQGPLIALGVGAALVLLPAKQAQERYVVCCAGLLAIVLSLGGTLAIMQESAPPTDDRDAAAAWVASTAESAPTITPPRTSETTLLSSTVKSLPPLPWATILGWVWLTGALAMLLQTTARLGKVQGVVRASVTPADPRLHAIAQKMAARLGIGRQVMLRINEGIMTPQTFGLWRPVVLLPAATLGAPVEMVEAALAHELAHIRRHDYAINLIQRVVECLLFFNPAVWWLSRQIRIERESSCDALAATALGNVAQYARGLADWYAISTGAPLPLAPALGDSADGSMLERIRRLLVPGYRPASASLASASVGLLLPVLGMVALLLGTGYGATVIAARALSDRERVQQVEAVAAEYTNDPVEESWWQEPSDTLEKAVIQGWVRTFDGSPLPKGTVVKVNSERPRLSSSYGVCHTQEAEESGQRDFTQAVEPGNLYVAATAPGYAPSFVGPVLAVPGSRPEALELVLQPGFEAVVEVLDESGAPIAGAEVSAKYDVPPSLRAKRIVTDVDGRAILPNASPWPVVFDVTAPGFERTWTTWTPSPNEIMAWTLQATAPLSITVVREGTQVPIADAAFYELQRIGGPMSMYYEIDYATDFDPIVRTDARGRAVLASLRNDTRYSFLVESPEGGRAILSGIHVSAGEHLVQVPEEIVLAGTVTGAIERLRDERGIYQLWLGRSEEMRHGHHQSHIALPVRVEGDVGYFRAEKLWRGRFVLRGDGVQQTFALTASREDVQIEIPPAAEEVMPEAPREVIVEFANVGDAPPGGTLNASYRPTPESQYISPTLVEIEKGITRFTVPTPNTLTLAPEGMTGYWFTMDQSSRNIEVPAGEEPLIVTVDLFPAGAIYGTIHEANGDPAESVMLSLVVEERPEALREHQVDVDIKNFASGNSDRIERFSALPLPLDGVYRIVAWRDTTFAVSEACYLTEKAPTAAVAMSLPEGVRFEGELRGPDGQPVVGATVKLLFSATGGASFLNQGIHTNRDGRFSFEHVNPDAAGRYSLSILPWEKERATYLLDVDIRHSPQVITLEPGEALSGRVVHQDTSEPLANVTLKATPRHSSVDIYPPIETTTDDEGHFRFTTLAPVTYFFHVEGASMEDPFSKENMATGGQEEPFVLRVMPH